ncbi:MAG: hypothetical protein HYV62_16760 [Candidatus Rokubacteria bacterium]|nr:hypothetical protein [Candidatus Rokubacteria bacterium]
MMRCVRGVVLAAALWLGAWPGEVWAYLTDGSVLAPINYSTFVPPAAGVSYLDATFGTAITRLSNAPQQPNAADTGTVPFIANEYATMSPLNADSSRLLLVHHSYFALYEPLGTFLRDLPLEITAASEPRWSPGDPDVFYYIRGNQLKRYSVSTGVASVVRTFEEYTSISGRGESDFSPDGDHLVLAGDTRDIFVYEISTDTKGPVLDTSGTGGFDQIYLTPANHVLVGWYAVGSGRYQGVELYDRNMTFLRQVTRALGHMDVTRDANGDEVVVWINAGDPGAPAACQNGVVKIRLSDAAETCLLTLPWSLAAHVSAPDGGGWVVVSTYAPGDPGPLDGWARYTNEILQVRLDGTEVRRLAHHRTRPFNSYWYTPRAAVSRDGSRLVYTSNYGLPAILGYPSAYSDVYLIDLTAAAPSSVGSERGLGTRVEQNSPVASYTCPPGVTWYRQDYPGHSGGSAELAMDPGCRATLDFAGTAVRWIAYRDEWAGIADVYLDGELRARIDLYASPAQAQAVVYTVGGLAPGPHALTLEVRGWRNPASGGAWVWVDAFEVVLRTEENDPTVSQSCPPGETWYSHTTPIHSGGGAVLAMGEGCRATFAFTGTEASWIGYRDEWAGIARVYVDGVLRAEVDTHASPAEAQRVIYTVSGLSPGPHTLTVEATGRRGPFSGGAWVWVDAFETAP